MLIECDSRYCQVYSFTFQSSNYKEEKNTGDCREYIICILLIDEAQL